VATVSVRVVADDHDVEQARREARRLAAELGFGRADVEEIGLAVSELATNLVRYAPGGQLSVGAVEAEGRRGVVVESRDQGPGIADTSAAMRDGFSTAGGLGAGLGGVQRLMDDFELSSGPAGTTVTCRKWRRAS
jgi:serine/threonine-protein kinase RsbT